MNEGEKKGPVMVDITSKAVVHREAIAIGKIILTRETIRLLNESRIEKGDPINTAKIAAILAAKNTSNLVPLCHPIPVTEVKIDEDILEDGIQLKATVKAVSKTGVEMEALTAVSMGLLAIWDMVKQYEKDDKGQYPTTSLQYIKVVKKHKGGS